MCYFSFSTLIVWYIVIQNKNGWRFLLNFDRPLYYNSFPNKAGVWIFKFFNIKLPRKIFKFMQGVKIWMKRKCPRKKYVFIRIIHFFLVKRGDMSNKKALIFFKSIPIGLNWCMCGFLKYGQKATVKRFDIILPLVMIF